MKETEGVEGLTRTVKLYEQDWVDKTVETYLTNMGVADPVMSLLRKTPAASIRWLSVDEIKASGLATGALDPAEPILAAAAPTASTEAGLARGKADVMTAKIGDRDASGTGLTFTYRRGGGALELALNESGHRTEAPQPTGRPQWPEERRSPWRPLAPGGPGPRPARPVLRAGPGRADRCDAESGRGGWASTCHFRRRGRDRRRGAVR